MRKPQPHADKVTRLQSLRAKGERARAHHDIMEEWVLERQNKLLAKLIAETRDSGEVSHGPAWELVALNGLMGEMLQQIGDGRRADRELAKIEQELRSRSTENA